MILQIVEFFESCCLFELAEKAIGLLRDKGHPKIARLRARIFEFKNDFRGCL